MRDYDSRILICSDTVDISKSIKFDVPKLCAYIKEQKKKGRKSEDITFEEVKQLLVK